MATKPKSDPSEVLDKVGRFSDSVKQMFSQLYEKQAVSSWDIVSVLLNLHPDYGRGYAKELIYRSDLPPPEGKERKPVWEWLTAVKDLYMPYRVDQIDTRLVIFGLTRIDKGLLSCFGGTGNPSRESEVK